MRKVLEREREQWGEYSFYKEITNAERSDAAKREEPVQALRQAVAELVARWMERSMPLLTAGTVRELLDELNAIIATKPDPSENRQATASGLVHDVREATIPKLIEKSQQAEQADRWREIKPVIEPVVADKVYEIASKAVRDAMPDVLDGLAKTFEKSGFLENPKAFRKHADKLRKERGT